MASTGLASQISEVSSQLYGRIKKTADIFEEYGSEVYEPQPTPSAPPLEDDIEEVVVAAKPVVKEQKEESDKKEEERPNKSENTKAKAFASAVAAVTSTAVASSASVSDNPRESKESNGETERKVRKRKNLETNSNASSAATPLEEVGKETPKKGDTKPGNTQPIRRGWRPIGKKPVPKVDRERGYPEQAKLFFLALVHHAFIMYETAVFESIQFITRFMINNKFDFVRHLAVQSARRTKYHYIGKKVHNPIWFGGLKKVLISCFIIWISKWVFLSLWMPRVSWMAIAVVGPEHQQRPVIVEQPLIPSDVTAFIDAYYSAKSVSDDYISTVRRTTHNIEDVETQREREALSRSQSNADGDDVLDMFEVQAVNIVLGGSAQGLSMSQIADMIANGETISGLDTLMATPNNVPSPTEFRPQYVKVEPVMPVSKRICDIGFGQYSNSTGNILINAGCYDLIQMALDLKYNIEFVCKQAESAEMKREVAGLPREYAGKMGLFKEFCTGALKRIHQNRGSGTSEHHCLNNVHFGITQPFVYSAIPGKEPVFLVNPKVVPMKYEDYSIAFQGVDEENSEINPMDHMILNTIVEDEGTPLGDMDKAFWTEMSANPLLRQPSNQIRVDALVMPNRSVLSKYFGAYGPALIAYINSFGLLIQNTTQSTTKGSAGYFAASLNELGNAINKQLGITTEEAAINNVVNYIIGQRSSIASAHRKYQSELLANKTAQLERREREGGISLERIRDTIARVTGASFELEGEAEFIKSMELSYPELQQRTNYPIHGQHVPCVLKANYMNDLLMRGRQIYNDAFVSKVTAPHYPLPSYEFIVKK